ncbi:hypothetical protein [Bacillus arachidis]|uniref:hypothetical protein n=1 Tax=Bacillus arachidis TaxID=2819290 RepID=UPI00255CF9DD|nr:hypothetical protein [Bacillus arachidis]WIY63724.1 hypothetical protein QRY57_16545 [Bacillus arachidis]
MPISVSDELQLFAQEIQSFLSPNILRDLDNDVARLLSNIMDYYFYNGNDNHAKNRFSLQ